MGITPSGHLPVRGDGSEGPPAPIAPEIVQQIIDNQTSEMTLRRDELEVRREQQQNDHVFANKALDAHATDRKDARQHRTRERRDKMVFAGAVVVLIALFVFYALAKGKDAIAMEALKAIVYLVAGGLGGYSLGRKEQFQQRSEAD